MILAVDKDGRRASVWCDPDTGGIYVTTDPEDETPLPEGAVITQTFYVSDEGKLIVSED